MNRSRRPKRQQDASTALATINARVSRWEGIARRRFNAGELTDQAVFESCWPQILTNCFYAETARVSLSLGFLSEDRNN